MRGYRISDSHSHLTTAAATAICLKDAIVWVCGELGHRLGLGEGITEGHEEGIIIAYGTTMLFQETLTPPSAFNFPFSFFPTVHTFNPVSLNPSLHDFFSSSEGKSTQRP